MTLRHHRRADVTDLREKVGILRYRRRGSHRPSRVRSKWLALLFLVAAAVVTWQFARQQPSSDFSHSPSGKSDSGLFQSRGGSASQAPHSDSKLIVHGVNRLVYPYSVIRGGVANPDELKRMMEYDPVVSRHFKGFDYRRAAWYKCRRSKRCMFHTALGTEFTGRGGKSRCIRVKRSLPTAQL